MKGTITECIIEILNNLSNEIELLEYFTCEKYFFVECEKPVKMMVSSKLYKINTFFNQFLRQRYRHL